MAEDLTRLIAYFQRIVIEHTVYQSVLKEQINTPEVQRTMDAFLVSDGSAEIARGVTAVFEYVRDQQNDSAIQELLRRLPPVSTRVS